MKTIALLFTVVLMADAAAAAVAGSDGSEMLIPIAGRTQGALGEVWTTELTVVNLTPAELNVVFTWLPQGGTAQPQTAQLSITPYTVRVIDDAVETLFGRTGIGAILIRSTNPAAAFDAHARISTGDRCETGGTQSQSVPAVLFTNWRNNSPAYVHGVRDEGGFRTNYGIVNLEDEPRQFRVYVNSLRGRQEELVTVPANGIVHRPVPQPVTGTVSVYFEPLDAGGRWHGYAASVDNFSGSGWTIPAMQPRADLVF